MGQERCIQSWLVDLRERDHLDNMYVDERILLKRIFNNWDGEA